MRTLDSLLFQVLKAFKVNRLYRAVQHSLPGSWNERIAALTMRNVHIPLVMVSELRPQYEKACNHLAELVGTAELGDYLEFGVSLGTSLQTMSSVLEQLALPRVRIFGFDSFEGLPASAAAEGKWQPGEFASPLEQTRQFLDRHGVDWQRTHLIKGWFSDTLTDGTKDTHHIRKASLIMIDCDLYSSARESLDFCAPLIKDAAFIFFDDWVDDPDFGERKAFDEFLAGNPHLSATNFGSYQPMGKIFIVTNLVWADGKPGRLAASKRAPVLS